MKAAYCENCEQEVELSKEGIDWLLVSVGLIVGIVPGLIYVAYYYYQQSRSKAQPCPRCNIPALSDKHTSKENDSGTQNATDNTTPSESGSNNTYHSLLTAVGIGFGTIILVGLWTGLIGGLYYGATGGISIQVDMLLSNVGLILGTVSIMAIYFRYSENDYSFIDISIPTVKSFSVAIAGTVGLLVTAITIERGFQLFNITAAEHRIYQLATAENGGLPPEFLLLMVPIAILIIGPTEEIAYRGLVQKSLYSRFNKPQAIVITSAIFALVHFPAYLTSTITKATITVVTVFALSLILGKIYAKTENIIIPSLSHGLYNAILFALLYIEVAGAA